MTIDSNQGASRSEPLHLQERDTRSSPMATLLPELLSAIFLIYAEDNSELFSLRWAHLLLVSRYWHDVAVHTPKLWSYIEFSDFEHGPGSHEAETRIYSRIDIQKFRAGSCPLTVRIQLLQGLSKRKEACLSTLWDPTSLSSLTVRGNRHCVQRVLQKLEAHRHTSLKHLDMICSDRIRSCSIPDVILGDHTPLLQHLSVNSMLFKLASVSGLNTLRIFYQRNPPVPFGLSDILKALAQCPLLEHLQIILPEGFRPKRVPGPGGLVLSKMNTIFLRGSNELCDNVFHALHRLPRTTKISVSVYDGSVNPSLWEHPSSLAYLGHHASQEGTPVIRTIGLVRQPRSYPIHVSQFGITGAADTDLPVDSGGMWVETGRPGPNTYVGGLGTTRKGSEVEMLRYILRAWPLAQVTHLDVRVCTTMDPDLWETLFEILPALTTVSLRPESQAAESFFDVLYGRLHDAGRCIVRTIILDLARTGTRTRSEVHPMGLASQDISHALSYCAAAARANYPLETIEVVNTREEHFSLTECTEASKNLIRGFVYQGILYSRNATAKHKLASMVDETTFPTMCKPRLTELSECSGGRVVIST